MESSTSRTSRSRSRPTKRHNKIRLEPVLASRCPPSTWGSNRGRGTRGRVAQVMRVGAWASLLADGVGDHDPDQPINLPRRGGGQVAGEISRRSSARARPGADRLARPEGASNSKDPVVAEIEQRLEGLPRLPSSAVGAAPLKGIGESVERRSGNRGQGEGLSFVTASAAKVRRRSCRTYRESTSRGTAARSTVDERSHARRGGSRSRGRARRRADPERIAKIEAEGPRGTGLDAEPCRT